MGSPLYSDRVAGPPPATGESLPAATANALLAYANQKVDSDWLAQAFPERCPDGNGICGTDHDAWNARRDGLIPNLGDPWSDEPVYDLLELVARDIAKPEQASFHSYFRHWEYRFDRAAGAAEFRADVNEYLSRAGVMYRMSATMTIERLGPETAQATVAALAVPSGEQGVDALLAQARALYVSRTAANRTQSVEKLWDVFERLKTLDDPDKKTSIAKMLSRIEPQPWREQVEAEMTALTRIGTTSRSGTSKPGRWPFPPTGSTTSSPAWVR